MNISVTATADVNMTADGQGAPVTIRVYQLGSDAGFKNAEFFKLYNADAATLGADLAKREDLVLNPGQTKKASLTPADQVKAIGLFAGYRDFQKVTWRATVDVTPHQTTNVTVTANGTGITVKSEVVPPPPPPAPKPPGA